MVKERTILHVDMNSCYASIELINHPEWKGKPLAVCGSVEDRHGIVLAKTQEAKILGVRTGEAVWEAKRKCPDLLIVAPHYDQYLYYSRLSRAIYEDYTSQIEPFGLDECWLDVSGSIHLFGEGQEIAETLRLRVKRELGLTVSVGVSFNKIFAKLGSDLKKPDAVTVIPRESFRQIVWPLPITAMIGIGSATKRKLARFNIHTLGELASCDPGFMRAQLGVNGLILWRHANGMDHSTVCEAGDVSPIKSVGKGITCREDLCSEREVYGIFSELAQEVSRRLHEYDLSARGVQITIKTEDLVTRQHQMNLTFTTQSGSTLSRYGMELFRQNYRWNRRVRALTIRAFRLTRNQPDRQICFLRDFQIRERQECIDQTIYRLNKRYGKRSVRYAVQKLNVKLPRKSTDVMTLPQAIERQV